MILLDQLVSLGSRNGSTARSQRLTITIPFSDGGFVDTLGIRYYRQRLCEGMSPGDPDHIQITLDMFTLTLCD